VYDGAFKPSGATVLIGTSPLQVLNNDGTSPTSYRVRAMLTTQQYLGWMPGGVSGNPPFVSVVAPVAGTPSTNVMGFAGLATETVVLPQNCFMRADANGAFEVTPGEGL
jgi:hypothetical protein